MKQCHADKMHYRINGGSMSFYYTSSTTLTYKYGWNNNSKNRTDHTRLSLLRYATKTKFLIRWIFSISKFIRQKLQTITVKYAEIICL